MAHALELNIDGPREESELAVCLGEDPHAPLTLAEYGKECAELWVQTYGRRFSCYKKRIDVNSKRGIRSGTERAVVEGRRAVADVLAKMVERASKDGEENTIAGCPRGKLLQRLTHGRFVDSEFWNKGYSKIQGATTKRKKPKNEIRCGLACGQEPLPSIQRSQRDTDSVPKRGGGLEDNGIAFCPSESTKK